MDDVDTAPASSIKRIPFTQADEETILGMVLWMRISAGALAVSALASLFAVLYAGQVQNVIGTVISLVLTKWLFTAAAAFEKVAKTDDDDQRFVAEGIANLKNIFLLKAIFIIVGMAVAALAVLGIMLVGMVMLAAA